MLGQASQPRQNPVGADLRHGRKTNVRAHSGNSNADAGVAVLKLERVKLGQYHDQREFSESVWARALLYAMVCQTIACVLVETTRAQFAERLTCLLRIKEQTEYDKWAPLMLRELLVKACALSR